MTTTQLQETDAPVFIFEDAYTESGDHSQGFWHNEIVVDLEELAAGNFEEAIRVVENIHDTAGMSFREYHGIDIHAQLPNGAKGAAIEELAQEIVRRAEELTNGFSVEWDGSNFVAEWDEEEEGATEAEAFWDNFKATVNDLAAFEVYDLSDYENRPYVIEALKEAGVPLDTKDAVYRALNDVYADDALTVYIQASDAAKVIFERLQDED